MNKEQLNEVLKKHKAWLNDEEGGERADFRGADLSGIDLRDADLRGIDFRGADLRGTDLRDADLRGTDLRGTDLIVFHLTFWSVYIHAITMRIGCQNHTHDDWLSFDDDTISKMHPNALEWWTEYKPLITAGIEIIKAQVEKKKLTAV